MGNGPFSSMIFPFNMTIFHFANSEIHYQRVKSQIFLGPTVRVIPVFEVVLIPLIDI